MVPDSRVQVVSGPLVFSSVYYDALYISVFKKQNNDKEKVLIHDM